MCARARSYSYPFILTITLTLSYFIYFAALGALLGLLFQLLFWMFRKLKRPDAVPQIKARPTNL